MNAQKNAGAKSRRTLADVFANLGYEVLPFKGTEENVLKYVPKTTRMTVTASPPKGIEATIALTEALAGAGYSVAPHLSARMIADKKQLEGICERMKKAGVDAVFIVGGDATDAAGKYKDALDLLKDLKTIKHPFKEIGIGGYPEGHAFIPTEKLHQALKDKAPYATYIATQICYDADTIVEWARNLKREGINLPIRVGMPGAVTRQKLMRISLASGVGDSVKFLKKQQSMFWRFFVPGGYSPNKLIQGLRPFIGADDNHLEDFHIFTFNDLEKTEAWRLKAVEKYSK